MARGAAGDLERGFGLVVRERRVEAGMTQQRLADLALISRNYVSDVERGLKSPTLSTVQRLATALEVEPHVLVKAAERVHDGRP